MRNAAQWLIHRAGLLPIRDKVLKHPVPAGTADRRKGWMYVFGIATLTAFLLQLVTGLALVTKYIPSAEHAQDSIRYISEQLAFGNLLRGMHFYGASAMLVLVALHMARVYLTGSYKYPREVQWLTGVGLLLLTIGMAFTGQLLRWEQGGITAVAIAVDYIGQVPLVGESISGLLLGGDEVGANTLRRFHLLHILVMPMLIVGLVGVHLYVILLHGVSEPPDEDRPVRPEEYRAWYDSHLATEGRPYFPDVAWREAVFAAVVVAAVFVLAAGMGPRTIAPPPAAAAQPLERPDWFLLWYHGIREIAAPPIDVFLAAYLPALLLAAIVLLPLLAPAGQRHPARRPWSIAFVLILAAGLIGLTYVGLRAHPS